MAESVGNTPVRASAAQLAARKIKSFKPKRPPGNQVQAQAQAQSQAPSFGTVSVNGSSTFQPSTTSSSTSFTFGQTTQSSAPPSSGFSFSSGFPQVNVNPFASNSFPASTSTPSTKTQPFSIFSQSQADTSTSSTAPSFGNLNSASTSNSASKSQTAFSFSGEAQAGFLNTSNSDSFKENQSIFATSSTKPQTPFSFSNPTQSGSSVTPTVGGAKSLFGTAASGSSSSKSSLSLFGETKPERENINKPNFSVGTSSVEVSKPATPSFSFGAPLSTKDNSTTPKFSFGTSLPTSAPLSTPSFSFGSSQAPTTTTKTPLFSFGAPSTSNLANETSTAKSEKRLDLKDSLIPPQDQLKNQLQTDSDTVKNSDKMLPKSIRDDPKRRRQWDIPVEEVFAAKKAALDQMKQEALDEALSRAAENQEEAESFAKEQSLGEATHESQASKPQPSADSEQQQASGSTQQSADPSQHRQTVEEMFASSGTGDSPPRRPRKKVAVPEEQASTATSLGDFAPMGTTAPQTLSQPSSAGTPASAPPKINFFERVSREGPSPQDLANLSNSLFGPMPAPKSVNVGQNGVASSVPSATTAGYSTAFPSPESYMAGMCGPSAKRVQKSSALSTAANDAAQSPASPADVTMLTVDSEFSFLPTPPAGSKPTNQFTAPTVPPSGTGVFQQIRDEAQAGAQQGDQSATQPQPSQPTVLPDEQTQQKLLFAIKTFLRATGDDVYDNQVRAIQLDSPPFDLSVLDMLTYFEAAEVTHFRWDLSTAIVKAKVEDDIIPLWVKYRRCLAHVEHKYKTARENVPQNLTTTQTATAVNSTASGSSIAGPSSSPSHAESSRMASLTAANTAKNAAASASATSTPVARAPTGTRVYFKAGDAEKSAEKVDSSFISSPATPATPSRQETRQEKPTTPEEYRSTWNRPPTPGPYIGYDVQTHSVKGKSAVYPQSMKGKGAIYPPFMKGKDPEQPQSLKGKEKEKRKAEEELTKESDGEGKAAKSAKLGTSDTQAASPKKNDRADSSPSKSGKGPSKTLDLFRNVLGVPKGKSVEAKTDGAKSDEAKTDTAKSDEAKKVASPASQSKPAATPIFSFGASTATQQTEPASKLKATASPMFEFGTSAATQQTESASKLKPAASPMFAFGTSAATPKATTSMFNFSSPAPATPTPAPKIPGLMESASTTGRSKRARNEENDEEQKQRGSRRGVSPEERRVESAAIESSISKPVSTSNSSSTPKSLNVFKSLPTPKLPVVSNSPAVSDAPAVSSTPAISNTPATSTLFAVSNAPTISTTPAASKPFTVLNTPAVSTTPTVSNLFAVSNAPAVSTTPAVSSLFAVSNPSPAPNSVSIFSLAPALNVPSNASTSEGSSVFDSPRLRAEARADEATPHNIFGHLSAATSRNNSAAPSPRGAPDDESDEDDSSSESEAPKKTPKDLSSQPGPLSTPNIIPPTQPSPVSASNVGESSNVKPSAKKSRSLFERIEHDANGNPVKGTDDPPKDAEPSLLRNDILSPMPESNLKSSLLSQSAFQGPSGKATQLDFSQISSSGLSPAPSVSLINPLETRSPATPAVVEQKPSSQFSTPAPAAPLSFSQFSSSALSPLPADTPTNPFDSPATPAVAQQKPVSIFMSQAATPTSPMANTRGFSFLGAANAPPQPSPLNQTWTPAQPIVFGQNATTPATHGSSNVFSPQPSRQQETAPERMDSIRRTYPEVASKIAVPEPMDSVRRSPAAPELMNRIISSPAERAAPEIMDSIQKSPVVVIEKNDRVQSRGNMGGYRTDNDTSDDADSDRELPLAKTKDVDPDPNGMDRDDILIESLPMGNLEMTHNFADGEKLWQSHQVAVRQELVKKNLRSASKIQWDNTVKGRLILFHKPGMKTRNSVGGRDRICMRANGRKDLLINSWQVKGDKLVRHDPKTIECSYTSAKSGELCRWMITFNDEESADQWVKGGRVNRLARLGLGGDYSEDEKEDEDEGEGEDEDVVL